MCVHIYAFVYMGMYVFCLNILQYLYIAPPVWSTSISQGHDVGSALCASTECSVGLHWRNLERVVGGFWIHCGAEEVGARSFCVLWLINQLSNYAYFLRFFCCFPGEFSNFAQEFNFEKFHILTIIFARDQTFCYFLSFLIFLLNNLHPFENQYVPKSQSFLPTFLVTLWLWIIWKPICSFFWWFFTVSRSQFHPSVQKHSLYYFISLHFGAEWGVKRSTRFWTSGSTAELYPTTMWPRRSRRTSRVAPFLPPSPLHRFTSALLDHKCTTGPSAARLCGVSPSLNLPPRVDLSVPHTIPAEMCWCETWLLSSVVWERVGKVSQKRQPSLHRRLIFYDCSSRMQPPSKNKKGELRKIFWNTS